DDQFFTYTKSAPTSASSNVFEMVAPCVNVSDSAYPFGWAMVKSTIPSACARHIHSENELGTACGNAFMWGAHAMTTLGFRASCQCSLMVTKSARLCSGWRVALSKLMTGTPQ